MLRNPTTPFVDEQRQGFFDVNVFSGRARHHCLQRVPMIGRGNHDGIDAFVVEQQAARQRCSMISTRFEATVSGNNHPPIVLPITTHISLAGVVNSGFALGSLR